MLDNITGAISLFLGASFVLYVGTKPKKSCEGHMHIRQISFKGAMKYSPMAMKLRSTRDEMHM